jgi:catechol 2,3-dioxygenase
MKSLITSPTNRLGAGDFSGTVIPFTKFSRPLRNDRIVSDTKDERMPAIRLGHVHLKVRALHRSLAFYREVLGLRLTERVGRFAFLAVGTEHHSVALEEVGPWTSLPPRRASGVAHVAFELPGRREFAAMREALLAAGVPIISRNNGISWTIRFKDPDHNAIEVYIDRRRSTSGTELWGGGWCKPFRLEDETAPTHLAAVS